jgi:hypothetical protein
MTRLCKPLLIRRAWLPGRVCAIGGRLGLESGTLAPLLRHLGLAKLARRLRPAGHRRSDTLSDLPSSSPAA